MKRIALISKLLLWAMTLAQSALLAQAQSQDSHQLKHTNNLLLDSTIRIPLAEYQALIQDSILPLKLTVGGNNPDLETFVKLKLGQATKKKVMLASQKIGPLAAVIDGLSF